MLTTTTALAPLKTSLGLPLVALACCFFAPEARADSLVIDPVGDTFGGGSVQLDVTSVATAYTNTALTFTVNFAGEVFAPSQGDANSVFGFIEIDADRNAATGAGSLTALLGSPPDLNLGVEYVINLSTEEDHPGFIDVFAALSGDLTRRAPIAFGVDSFSVTVPLSFVGGSGRIDYAAIFGTFDEATDRVPNGMTPATSVPEPATLLLLGTGLVGAAAGSRRRLKRCPAQQSRGSE